MSQLLALLRRLQTRLQTLGKSRYLTYGTDLHIGRGARLWAARQLSIGNHVYIGKDVHIEANCEIGDYCLFANRVSIVGRNDHDFNAVGFPMRYAPWVGSQRFPSPHANEMARIEADVWLGYGVTVLTGATVGRGSVVAAGSVVVRDIPPYSIAAGVPARVVAKRFTDAKTIEQHEFSLKNGRYQFSELGYDHCRIEPIGASIHPVP